MKGTPFFTGEYATRTGPADGRVNLWPLLYYREPALSVLWPLGEYTGDRLALRPLFLIEDLDRERPVYNVLWPLGRFDTQRDNHRFFPLFWGADHRVVFPLYWHLDRPFAEDGKGSDALWPLWCYFSDQRQYSLHLLWPLFNAKSYDDERGGRLWPLYGGYEQPNLESGYRYALWPLAWHTWDKTGRTRTLLPLFHDAREPDAHTFATLMGGWHHNRTTDTTDWCALPILGWGTRSPAASRTRALLGLYGHHREEVSHGSRLLPLYYYSQTPEQSLFLSPLYLSSAAADGESWRMVVPLAFHSRSPHRSSLYTPLYSQGADTEAATRWSCLLPLFYEDRRPEGATFVTPLGGWWTDAARKSWAVYPLLSGGRRRADGGDLWLGGPLFHASWNPAGTSHWLLPLYSYNHDTDTFLSPLYSSWHTANGGNTRLLPPLLSAYTARTNRWDLWALAGLGHASGGPEGGSDHLIPLFYADHQTLLTPLYGRWEGDGTVIRYWLTPLLGTRYGREHGSWLAPLYSHTADPASASSHGWYLAFGEYRRSPREAYTFFPLLFEHEQWRTPSDDPRGPAQREGWRFNALLLAEFARYDYLEPRTPTAALEQSQIELPPVNEPMRRSECRLFPVWDYRSDHSATSDWQRASGSLLLCLYDYRREQGLPPPESAPHDYTRRRVLFRLYHHERLNGALSVDLFPGMTYDRDPAAGTRTFSLLWRLFRYARTPEKRACDLLFIPVWRQKLSAGR